MSETDLSFLYCTRNINYGSIIICTRASCNEDLNKQIIMNNNSKYISHMMSCYKIQLINEGYSDRDNFTGLKA